MDILSCLSEPAQWQAYFEYKRDGGHLLNWEEKALSDFISNERYRPVVENIRDGGTFPPPKKSAISKMSSKKKRIVYTYPKAENYVLKLMTYLLLRKYDHLFAPNLYSFRAKRSAKDAIRSLSHGKNIDQMWSYKADISDYFNSIPVEQMLPKLEGALCDEPELYHFLAGLLTNPLVCDQGELVVERKGIMAGTPVSTFLANLYLAELDEFFARSGRLYARYSDDIILFAPTQEELERDISLIHDHLAQAGLTMNPAKESRTAPGEQWVFLGFAYQRGVIDIAPASIEKLKGKMRRKTRALMRWKTRKGKEGVHAARAFIKVFNRKLFETCADHDLTWARWYFPTISTTDSLHVIDQYAQSCIRYLATGKHTKAAYNFRYEQMKDLGYVSLVNRYYADFNGISAANSEETVAKK